MRTESLKKAQKKYMQGNGKDKWNSYQRQYYKKYGKKYDKKKYARKHNLNCIPIMDNPFPEEIEIEWHHINNLLIIPIPKITHKITLGSNHRNNMNNMIYKYLYLDVKNILN